jgi:hypothetical protein
MKARGLISDSGTFGELPVDPLHLGSERLPHDLVEMKGLEHFMEVADVAELFGEVDSADLVLRSLAARKLGRGVPGAGDADPLVAGKFVDAGQHEGLAIELPHVLLHGDVVAVEELRVDQGLAGADRVRFELGELLALAGQFAIGLEELAGVALGKLPIILKVRGPLLGGAP